MIDPNQDSTSLLHTIFAAEAGAHLRELDAALLALEHDRGRGGGARIASMLMVLHTLKGAAHSMALGDLELLCDTLEVVLSAAGDPARLAPDDCQLIRAALELAPQLAATPGGRVRNQAAAVRVQLAALGAQLLAPPPQPAPLRQLNHRR